MVPRVSPLWNKIYGRLGELNAFLEILKGGRLAVSRRAPTNSVEGVTVEPNTLLIFQL